jgi:hypothetical protein
MPLLSLVSASIADPAPFLGLLPGLSFSPVSLYLASIALLSSYLLAYHYAGLTQYYEHSFVLRPSSS